ncbi:ABC transporter substrate-binding protein [Bradyrhizobium sp. WYCCWR 13022]|uniref:ABC transporter substrate-binding protein n=1 Tax=Bradyrhizobium TaxID=374 RepID=UPI001EDC64E8|nr:MULTISPECIES: ABC transporter substrate-binding protein [Bradyrhizobium]MCG2643379.1 ABC transporter substrate-binding protein [Bradyrhizobium zhengyangense]MDN4985959.1 ABC transporter substrate-binding protein [Bradyrhizobium sp. WYCCWR 13022]
MKRFSLLAFAAVLASLSISTDAHSAEVKIGIIGSFSGPYAEWGVQFKRAVDLYVEKHGGKLGGHTVEVLYRDSGGPNPARAKQLAQELITREGVQFLGGMDFTPNAVAVADVVTQAKIPFVIFNANTADTTRKSPYFLRVGCTIWQLAYGITRYAIDQGKKKAVVFAVDYAPGHDAIAAYDANYGKLGGKIVDVVKVPLDTTDFSSYFQRLQDANADVLFTFVPNGPISVALFKGYFERGLAQRGLQYFGLGETEEAPLAALGQTGELAIGVYSSLFYGPHSPESTANKEFVNALEAKYGKGAIPNIGTVEAWDGIHLIAHMTEATDGKLDGENALAAAKGYSWESPRGSIRSNGT